MPQGFRYDERTGAAVARVHASTDDGFDAQAVPGFGVIRSNASFDDVWIKEGVVTPREPLDLETASFTMLLGDTLTLTFPADACLMHELEVLESNGVVTFTPDEMGETRLRVVGRYKAPDILVRVTSLEVERTALRAAVDAKKQSVVDGGTEHNGHRWDANAASQDSIKGAAQTAQLGLLPPDFYWTSRDNENVPRDAEQIIALAQAIVGFAFAAHSRAQEIKKAIESASTLDALAAISMESGWPV